MTHALFQILRWLRRWQKSPSAHSSMWQTASPWTARPLLLCCLFCCFKAAAAPQCTRCPETHSFSFAVLHPLLSIGAACSTCAEVLCCGDQGFRATQNWREIAGCDPWSRLGLFFSGSAPAAPSRYADAGRCGARSRCGPCHCVDGNAAPRSIRDVKSRS